MNLKVILEPSDEGGFTAVVPALPGCISEGDTREEALGNIREAIQLYRPFPTFLSKQDSPWKNSRACSGVVSQNYSRL